MAFTLSSLFGDIEKAAVEIPAVIEKVLGLAQADLNTIDGLAKELCDVLGALGLAAAADGLNISLDAAAASQIMTLIAQIRAALALKKS
jgi:hypothetical protein